MSEKPKRNFWQLFSHPVFNFISLVLAILGFFFGFYFYYAAKSYPQLTVYVHPVKANIIKAGQTSDIKTFYKDKEINTDVTVAQVAIWNEGNTSIKKENILKPIIISIENNAPILEATIRKSTREVTQLNLNQDDIQKGYLTVSWNILEQNDGGVIQIIYAGDSQAKISLEGVIEGQKEINKSIPLTKIKSPEEQYIARKSDDAFWIYALIALTLVMGTGILLVGLSDTRKDWLRLEGKLKFVKFLFNISQISIGSLLLLTGIFLILYSLFWRNPTLPFDLN